MDINLRKRDRFDGESNCSNCRRELDGSCPAGYRLNPKIMVCDYHKIITPAFMQKKGEENASR